MNPPPAIRQREMLQRRAEYRLQGVPQLRRTPRATRGGGFGDTAAHPHAWTVWFQVDGVWRQLESERGLPREWTSLDRAAAWLGGADFHEFRVCDTSVEGVEPPER